MTTLSTTSSNLLCKKKLSDRRTMKKIIHASVADYFSQRLIGVTIDLRDFGCIM